MSLSKHETSGDPRIAAFWQRWSAGFLVTAALTLGPGTPVAGQQADGSRLFQQRCGACHALEPGRSQTAPPLRGIIGRKAGSADGVRYSDSMQKSSIVWDGQTLDAFLAAPRQIVPGTSMSVAVPNAAQRTAIIGFLEAAP